jgi:phage terminase large subunit-like protein
MSDEELRRLLAEVYAGAPWVDLGRLLLEVRDPAAPWPETLRFFFNLPAAGMLAMVDPPAWDALRTERTLEAGETISLGFDGSDTRDATALVAITADGCLIPLEIIERPAGADDDWRVDRARIHKAVERAFDTYYVTALYADPWGWRSELADWAARWPGDRVLEVPTNSTARMAELVDRFRVAVAEGTLRHDGNPDLRRHVLNARLRKVGRSEDGRGRFTVEKAGPGRLIDACVAAMLALQAREQVSAPELPNPFLVYW